MTITASESGAERLGKAAREASVGDYVVLLKPRVMSLVVFTALVGMVLAPAASAMSPVLAGLALAAIALGAGASGALNMAYDADIDAVMTRTRGRPVARGMVAPSEAWAFGIVLSLLSVLVLAFAANFLAAALLAFTIVFYAVVYTMWLKRWTPQNIVIGGAAGALPPVVGWAAVSGSLALEPLVLFAIIFLWTPPHFWALALLRPDDYARAGVPMLPVVAGPDATRRQIVLYAVLYLASSLAPVAFGFAGLAYGAGALVLGVVFARAVGAVWREREGEPARQACRRLFAVSILHLFGLFVLLLVERIGSGLLGFISSGGGV